MFLLVLMLTDNQMSLPDLCHPLAPMKCPFSPVLKLKQATHFVYLYFLNFNYFNMGYVHTKSYTRVSCLICICGLF